MFFEQTGEAIGGSSTGGAGGAGGPTPPTQPGSGVGGGPRVNARRLARRARERRGAVVVRPLLDGRVAEIRFRRGDDVAAVARDFVAAEGLNSGGGCDDASCVADGAEIST